MTVKVCKHDLMNDFTKGIPKYRYFQYRHSQYQIGKEIGGIKHHYFMTLLNIVSIN